MPLNRFDRSLWIALFAALLGLAWLVATAARPSQTDGSRALDRALERRIAYQAKVSLIRELYDPVEALRKEGQDQAALLKLAEIGKDYPGEAHGQILKGEIQARLGALDASVASYAAGVRLSGDYVDKESPLTRRDEIGRLVSAGLKSVGERVKAHPDNRTAAATMKELYYLQSRLAGGCE